MTGRAISRPGPKALLVAAWNEYRSSPADRPARVIALALFVLCLVAGAISASRWFDGGVDGILSQRPAPTGFEVRQVRAGAAADVAGLVAGDVIVARDGTPSVDREAYWAARRAGHAGQVVVLSVRRVGVTSVEERQLTLTPVLSIPDQVVLFIALLLVQILIPAAGTIVLLARPRDTAARLFFVAGLANTFATTLFLWDKAVGTTVDPVWHWYGFVLPRWFGAVAYTHLLLLFPAVHPWAMLPRRFGWQVVRWSSLMLFIYLVPLTVATYVLADAFTPAALGALVAPRADITRLSEVAIPFAAPTLLALAYGYRRAKGVAARAALGWLVFAIAFRAVSNVWGTSTAQALTGMRVEPVSQSFAQISALLVYAGIAVALVRYRLFEVSPLVRRAIVYPLAIAILIGVYDLVAEAFARGLAEVVGPDLSHNPLIAGLPVLIILALLRPLKSRLEALLDRRIDRPRWAVEAFAAEAEAVVSGASTLPTDTLLTTRAAERLGLSGASIVDARSVASGADGMSASIPLVVTVPGLPDRVIGVWILGRRLRADPFDEAELRVLERVARLAAFRLDHQRLLAQTGPRPISA